MRVKGHMLLAIDAAINLFLGILLMLAPVGALEFLGLPTTDSYSYATILGGVLLGIGIALLIGVRGAPPARRGLGLDGAIAINIYGATVLLVWLLLGNLEMPFSGQVVLWIVAVTVW